MKAQRYYLLRKKQGLEVRMHMLFFCDMLAYRRIPIKVISSRWSVER